MGFEEIRQQIIDDLDNASATARGILPLYTAGSGARIALVGQAPGRKAEESGVAWDDASGVTLKSWLGVSDEQFRDTNLFTILPMDFYYPGKAATGDAPPRKGFADTWHPRLLELMPDVSLTILIGSYAQKHYLGKRAARNLTETVRGYADYLPEFFPLVHPSPLNFRWQAKNPWFEREVVPALRERVAEALGNGVPAA
ncbi:uracil-DNA glycosylase [Microbacterium sorbitolivorans]|uniref:Uracil-DNA glycosylase family protein n=1 Tax=Microbacterium sorbitolivorans TaxID=1867410 RepID=A0A367Y7M2_9MICO|nr:uracil-DNA glycosylase family protein [Microbacterium sorbitolivorans]RCK61876.1 uracil-DNA glycosylase family protein [Microbacterium sorbitolivorans]GGF44940.1 uracil-DNA glycosylase [Microbacterium sorbitolivorans]